jgi:3-dehydroquinate synthase
MAGPSTDMYELDIVSSTENYKVSIGVELGTLLKEFDAVVADKFFEGNLSIEKPVHWVDSRESNKNLTEVEAVCAFFQKASLNRNSRILAIGGGIIQDLTTLAASIYMRGIKWSYLPTTLTGMMDSCLGGKSSINVGKTKNLVGNIYPPTQIFVDTVFVTSLDSQSLTSGLAEGVKIVFARGPEAFSEFLENVASAEPNDSAALQNLIHLTLNSKKWFIEVDEFDKAERQLLNFGHSFGHAFEAACNFSIQHGLGVALGVLAALNHPAAAQTHHSLLLKSYCEELVSHHHQIVKFALEATDWSIFTQSLRSDKKNTSESLVLILPSHDEPLIKVHLPFSEDSLEIATSTMKSTLKQLLKQWQIK